MTNTLDYDRQTDYFEGMTLASLHQLVREVDRSGYETIPFSKGMNLICRHPSGFLQFLRRQGDVNVEDFFAEHLGEPESDLGLLLNSGMLLLATGSEMLEFIRQIVLQCGPTNSLWLRIMQPVGVSQADVAELILEKLRAAPPVKTEYSVWSFLTHDFVEYGAGRVERHGACKPSFYDSITYWSMLSDEQLLEAMRIVASKAPFALFAYPSVNHSVSVADKLAARLGDEVVNQLLEETAELLQYSHMGYVSIASLQQLSLDTQLKLARRIEKPSPQWVIAMALELGAKDGEGLVDEFREVLLASTIQVYQTWRSRYFATTGTALRGCIEGVLQQGLRQAGWQIVTLREVTFKNRQQVQVRVEGVKYVQERHQREYGPSGQYLSPAAGDLVAFRPESAYQLGTGIKAVSFTFISRPKS